MLFFGLLNGLIITYGDLWPTLPPELIRDAVLRLVGSRAAPAAVISLVAIIPWWKTVPPGAWVGAAFDLLLIIILLLPLKDRILDIVR